MKRKNIYRETYKAGAMKLRKECLPVLKHRMETGEKFVATDVEVLAMGSVEIDGVRHDYQDLRVYVGVKP